MNIVFELQNLKQQLQQHESIKNSCMQGKDWQGRKDDLVKRFYLLRVKLIDSQIQDLQSAKQRLEIDYKRGVCIWQ